MRLLLADPGDRAARWAWEGLAGRGLVLEEVSSLQLCAADRWVHEIDSSGAAVEVRLADGRTLRHTEVRSALNRLSVVPPEWLSDVATADREYAHQELMALLCSALQALPGVIINRPSPGGLGGRWRSAVEWATLAGRSGLATPDIWLSSPDGAVDRARSTVGERRDVFVVMGRAVGGVSLGPAVEAGCVRLAAAAGAELLGVEFLVPDGSGEPVFAGASTLPDLRRGGDPLLDVLADALAL